MYKKIGIFGAGTMGTNIAQEFAMHGMEVNLYSRSQTTLDKSKSIMEKGYELLIEEGMLSSEEMKKSLARITFTSSVETCAKGCDIIMETIIENPEAKRQLFEQLDNLCPMETIFTSDTSALNIYELVPKRRLPNTLITHYFAPAHLIPLVELVKGEETSPSLVEKIKKMYQDMGKIPIVIEKILPGFVINRLQTALGREINYLLDNGYIGAEDLDLAAKSSLMFRGVVLGLVQRVDFTGIDARFNIEKNSAIEPAPKSDNSTVTRLYEQGHYGVKTGKGFYDYGGRTTEEVLTERDRRLINVWRAAEKYIRNPV